jgi:hypothetical protein
MSKAIPAAATSLPPSRRSVLHAVACLPLAALSACVPDIATAAVVGDPILPLYGEALAIRAFISRPEVDDDACEASVLRLRDIDYQVFVTQATTAPGAIASLEWARAEFVEHYDEGGQGDRLILALIDGALGVLRAKGGAA